MTEKRQEKPFSSESLEKIIELSDRNFETRRQIELNKEIRDLYLKRDKGSKDKFDTYLENFIYKRYNLTSTDLYRKTPRDTVVNSFLEELREDAVKLRTRLEKDNVSLDQYLDQDLKSTQPSQSPDRQQVSNGSAPSRTRVQYLPSDVKRSEIPETLPEQSRNTGKRKRFPEGSNSFEREIVPLKDMLEKSQRSSVNIIDSQAAASGVILKIDKENQRMYLITNKHVTKTLRISDEIKLQFYEQEIIISQDKVRYIDSEEKDLGVVEVNLVGQSLDFNAVEEAVFQTERPKANQEIYVVGNMGDFGSYDRMMYGVKFDATMIWYEGNIILSEGSVPVDGRIFIRKSSEGNYISGSRDVIKKDNDFYYKDNSEKIKDTEIIIEERNGLFTDDKGQKLNVFFEGSKKYLLDDYRKKRRIVDLNKMEKISEASNMYIDPDYPNPFVILTQDDLDRIGDKYQFVYTNKDGETIYLLKVSNHSSSLSFGRVYGVEENFQARKSFDLYNSNIDRTTEEYRQWYKDASPEQRLAMDPRFIEIKKNFASSESISRGRSKREVESELVTDAVTLGGNSGGGVFNGEGQVVGIHQSSLGGEEASGPVFKGRPRRVFGLYSREVQTLVEKAKKAGWNVDIRTADREPITEKSNSNGHDDIDRKAVEAQKTAWNTFRRQSEAGILRPSRAVQQTSDMRYAPKEVRFGAPKTETNFQRAPQVNEQPKSRGRKDDKMPTSYNRYATDGQNGNPVRSSSALGKRPDDNPREKTNHRESFRPRSGSHAESHRNNQTDSRGQSGGLGG